MQLIGLNIVMVVFLILISQFSEAQMNLGIPLSGNTMKECPEFRRIDIGNSMQAAIGRALENRRMCERAEILFNVAFVTSRTSNFQDFTRHGPRDGFGGSEAHELAQRKLVEALYSAEDTVATINQANIYINTYPRSGYRRGMHYYLLLAQNKRIRPVGNDQTDTYIALGMDPAQVKYQVERNVVQMENGTQLALGFREIRNPNFSEYKYRRSFMSFVDAYENSPGDDLTHIYSLYDRAAVRAQEKELDVGMYYYKQKEYMAAIGRFKMVTNAGPVHGLANGGSKIWDVWDESAYYTGLSFMEMGKALLGLRTHTRFVNNRQIQQAIESIVWHVNQRSMLIPDSRIAHWLRMDSSEYTPGRNGHPTRQELARVCFQNAGMIVNELKNERSSSKFDDKLVRELNRKVNNDLKRLVPDVMALLNL